jgi:predicted aconitase with swiveling domain
VTIQGQVFTFKTTLGSTAGNVLIGGSADVARANLAALINAPTTTTANGVALTADSDNARLFDARASAVNDNTANTLTLTFK